MSAQTSYPTTSRFRMLRLVNGAVGTVLLAQAVVIAVIYAGVESRLMRPVTAVFPGVAPADFAETDIVVAAIVLLGISAVVRLAMRVPGAGRGYSRGLADGRNPVRWAEYSQVSAITLFLIAQLNGITEVSSLVPLFAIAAGSTLFLALQEAGGPVGSRPFIFGAMVGIVPWGVIAFVQVGAGIVDATPPLYVRVLTISMLIVAVAVWSVSWLANRKAGPWSDPITAEITYVALVALGSSTFAWQVLAAASAAGG